ncbi:MAG: UDP-glucose 4-epimerase GalE [Betaproteobacteria bacterium]|nr:UDP-glucose 4-epimerase GalE [Betaproteobacteria bacterium]
MRILVVGGAGYIGSHMTKLLLDEGHEPMVVDNLSSGHRDAVPRHVFLNGDLRHRVLLDSVLSSRHFDGVMHFASCIQVGESMTDPGKYYWNNVANTLNLLDAMMMRGVTRLIFSSTAAIYGEPRYVPIDEEHPKAPLNPYGRSKWMVEQVLADYERAYGLRHVCLRYFNAAGAHPSGTLGERHRPETHLIPLVLRVASGNAPAVKIFGTDYDTPDGTCIRDYVHVTDLCRAHLLAMEYLMGDGASRAYNLGNGNGFSVKQVIDAASRVTAGTIAVSIAGRREGDPARLVADSALARRELGWQPQYPGIDTIVAHAWVWEQRASRLQPAYAAAR